MNKIELRASLGLAGIYALRMLGMFLILPVFMIYIGKIPGGNNYMLAGIAMGAYGLTQAIFQLPFGLWSDKVGRKKVIYIGLLLFMLGSVICALASNIIWMIIGRVIQGSGAVSAAVTALLSDLTREEHRTKAMAIIGISIATTFALSLVIAPSLFQAVGLSGIFAITALLALIAIIVTAKYIPDPMVSSFPSSIQMDKKRVSTVIHNPQLLRLNYGIFILHATQMALFITLPLLIQNITQLPVFKHWKIYLPVVLASFLLMGLMIAWGEKKRCLKPLFIAAIVFIFVAQLGFTLSDLRIEGMLFILLIYFVGFNILEALLPSLVSRAAPANCKGTAIGIYNTSQSLGIFLGSAISGTLFERFGMNTVFLMGAAFMVSWLIVAISMQSPQAVKTKTLRIDERWCGDAITLTKNLGALGGVKEAVVIIDERMAYLKVSEQGWDEAGAKLLVKASLS